MMKQNPGGLVRFYPGHSWIKVDVPGVFIDSDTLDRLSLRLRAPRPVWPPQACRWALYEEMNL